MICTSSGTQSFRLIWPQARTFALVLFSVALFGECAVVLAQEKKKDVSEKPKSKKETIENEILARLDRLTDEERLYVISRVKNKGKVPTLFINERTIKGCLQEGEWGILTFVVPGVEVQQVIDENTLLINPGGEDGRIIGNLWLEGVDTEGVVDNSEYPIHKHVIVVSGTKNYVSVTGAKRTIKRLVVCDTAKANDVYAQIHELRSYRQWTDKQGNVIGEAKFIDYQIVEGKGIVVLKDIETGNLEVSMSDLQSADQKWVRDELKKRKSKKKVK